MREIKFRGKTEDTGKWVYGNIQVPSKVGVEYFMWDDDGYQVPVNTDTIGQFTGLKDKNGTDIYEGDILVDEENSCKFSMIWFDGCFKLHCKGLHLPDVIPAYERLQRGVLRIIGNIHDNPELLT